MTWVRLDDGFAWHPKIVEAGALGAALQVAALCYCNRYLTDGFVPAPALNGLLNLDGIDMHVSENGGAEHATAQLIARDLVAAGLWKRARGGYRIHDYLDFQPSRDSVLQEREKTRERVKKHRARNAVTNAVVTGPPNPTRTRPKRRDVSGGSNVTGTSSKPPGFKIPNLKTVDEGGSA